MVFMILQYCLYCYQGCIQTLQRQNSEAQDPVPKHDLSSHTSRDTLSLFPLRLHFVQQYLLSTYYESGTMLAAESNPGWVSGKN